MQWHRSHIWGPQLMVRVVPDHDFSIVGLSHFERGIGHYTWLACKTDISEEVRSHQSNVISRLFVVPGPPTDLFRTTNSIAFILQPINETVTNHAALNWFRAPKRFNLWLSENFCHSQRMQESIDPKAWITYMGSKIDGPSGTRPRFFHSLTVILSVVLAIIHD